MCFQVIQACSMLLLSVDYFYSVMLRRGEVRELNVIMTSSVPKLVLRFYLTCPLIIDDKSLFTRFHEQNKCIWFS